ECFTGARLPVLDLKTVVVALAAESAFGGDGDGRVAPRARQDVRHFADDLREHRLRVLRPVEQGVEVRSDNVRDAREDAHGWTSKWEKTRGRFRPSENRRHVQSDN